MFERFDSPTPKVRLLISGLVVVGGLLVAFLIVTITGAFDTVGAAQAAPAHTTKPAGTTQASSYDDDANAVTSGFAGMLQNLGSSTVTASAALDRASASVAASANHTSRLVLAGVQAGATYTGHSFIKSLVLLSRLPDDLVAPITHVAMVGAIIRPGDKTAVPIITDAKPELPAASNKLASIQDNSQPAPAAADDTPAWPIHGIITTMFGVPEPPYEPIHTGLDISDGRAPGTTPIKPFKPGKVIQVAHSSLGLGNHIVIDHGGGLTSVYGHLNSTAVQEGQQVDKNTVLGYEGTTGVSTGTHLHFEIRQDGVAKNPLLYIAGRP